MEQRHPPPEGGLALPPISIKASLEKASDKNPVYFIAHWVTPMRIQKQPVTGGELQAIQ